MSQWEIDESSYQATLPLKDKLLFWLQYAILAPSAHNNQPWKVQLTDTGIIVRADMELVSSGTPRLTAITLGAFIENFVEAAQHFGYTATVSPFSSSVSLSNLAIEITVTEKQGEDSVSFAGITKRHTNRGLYSTEPINENLLKELQNIAPESGTRFHFVTEQESREKIAELAGKGMRVAVTLPPLRRELARFVYWQREQSEIGMYVESMVQHPKEADSGKDFILHHIDIPNEARFTYEKFRTAPLHVVLSSTADNMPSWIATGRSLQRLLNLAAARGLNHDIAAAPTEIPPFLPRVRSLLGTSEKPQLTLRLGKAQDSAFTHHSPRRPVSSILTD
jgi:hypothetical protein